MALVLHIMTYVSALAKEQFYPWALMALGQERLSEGEVSRQGNDREAHDILEGQLRDRTAQVARTSLGQGSGVIYN